MFKLLATLDSMDPDTPRVLEYIMDTVHIRNVNDDPILYSVLYRPPDVSFKISPYFIHFLKLYSGDYNS